MDTSSHLAFAVARQRFRLTGAQTCCSSFTGTQKLRWTANGWQWVLNRLLQHEALTLSDASDYFANILNCQKAASAPRIPANSPECHALANRRYVHHYGKVRNTISSPFPALELNLLQWLTIISAYPSTCAVFLDRICVFRALHVRAEIGPRTSATASIDISKWRRKSLCIS